ncbi:MAG TPA: nitrous oxide reductase accessory protein NosL [Gemmatimonadales bacterium]|nr:nitrous oxide reductase accessory protein NosL [Gemmatimonadales bacterium]
MAKATRRRGLIGFGVGFLAAACGSPGPRQLVLGTETCSQCHMTLADPRFAAELVLRTGKALPFDDPGCLATFLTEGSVPRERVHSLWVNDFLPPHDLLDVGEAVFLVSDGIRTPMDHRIAALRPGPSADSLRASLGGELRSWDEVLALVRGRPARSGGGSP